MIAASWGEPEVYHYVVVTKHSAYRLIVYVQCAVNRIHYKCRSYTCTFLIYPGVSLAYLTFFSSSPLYPSEYSHMLQVPVNYHGNSSSDECTYQPYMECQ